MSSPPSQPPSTRSTPAPRARSGPRAGVTRKTKAEREKYAAEQAEREKKRTATPSTSVQAPTRGRGAGRGGRGGLQRESSHAQADGTGFGVFGSAVGVNRVRDSKKGQQGQEEWLAGGVAKKDDFQDTTPAGSSKSAVIIGPGGAADSSVPHRVVDQAVAIASDDELDVGRRDIERIWISSDDDAADADEGEDEIITSKGKQRVTIISAKQNRPKKSSTVSGGLRPVRAPRIHPENEVGDDEHTTNIKPLGRRSKRESTTAPVVLDDSADAMDVDNDAPQSSAVKDIPSSPELKKKSLAKRPTPRSRDARQHALETAEERAERLRVIEDTSRLMDVFVDKSAIPAPLIPGTLESTIATKGHDKQPSCMEEGRLFLMQFPPMTPMLVDPVAEAAAAAAASSAAADATSGDVQIKSEHDASGAATAQRNQQQQQQQHNAAHQTGILTAPDISSPPLQSSTSTAGTRLPAGRVGKLKIHASGKVSLDWGGVDMEVKWGTDVDFLQDAVLVDSEDVLSRRQHHDGDVAEGWGDRAAAAAAAPAADGDVAAANGDDDIDDAGDDDDDDDGENGDGGDDKEKDNGNKEKGKVYALGQVVGKLVAVPDWGRLYD